MNRSPSFRRQFLPTLGALLLLVATSPHRVLGADSANLVTNGNFESAQKSPDWPDDWGRAKDKTTTWEQESGNHFLRLHSERLQLATAGLPRPLVPVLAAYGWPGNVRELRNYIERSVSLGTIAPLHAPAAAPPPEAGPVPPDSIERFVALHLPFKEARRAWTESFELVYVRAMLKRVGGNVTRAAERAGVSRRFLQRMVARLGIKPGDGTGDD